MLLAMMFCRCVDPGPQHRFVVAQQHQKHRRRGQQHPCEGLHALGQQAQHRVGTKDTAAETVSSTAYPV